MCVYVYVLFVCLFVCVFSFRLIFVMEAKDMNRRSLSRTIFLASIFVISAFFTKGTKVSSSHKNIVRRIGSNFLNISSSGFDGKPCSAAFAMHIVPSLTIEQHNIDNDEDCNQKYKFQVDSNTVRICR